MGGGGWAEYGGGTRWEVANGVFQLEDNAADSAKAGAKAENGKEAERRGAGGERKVEKIFVVWKCKEGRRGDQGGSQVHCTFGREKSLTVYCCYLLSLSSFLDCFFLLPFFLFFFFVTENKKTKTSLQFVVPHLEILQFNDLRNCFFFLFFCQRK